jgi:hypothetical protein
VLNGDAHAETLLSEIVTAKPFPSRHTSMESLYMYGSHASVWWVLRLFEQGSAAYDLWGRQRAHAQPADAEGVEDPARQDVRVGYNSDLRVAKRLAVSGRKSVVRTTIGLAQVRNLVTITTLTDSAEATNAQFPLELRTKRPRGPERTK